MKTDKEIPQEELLKKRSENIKNMFGSIVGVYDLLNALLSLNFDKSWRKFAAKVSDINPDTKILDVCTGTGDLAISYSKLLNGNGLVVGSDYCHNMLKYGLPKIKKRQLDNKIKLIEADTLQLPFRDNAFEISTVAFGIRNVADLEAGIKEMRRVVGPNGRVVILEFSQPTNFIFKQIYLFYFTRILPMIGRLISKSKDDAYSYLPKSVLAFPDKLSLKKKMEKCGLEDVKFYTRTLGIVTVHIGKKPLTNQPTI
ncbi:MAG: bifunctional demethylmenaquinone methyltransferase/2-methoxy-6-polyprenyl-1,4-benzoquinol methylase UbiE [Candidatus Brocadiaceae bacterium]|nr:bifunctional demethylmenaquinone methyltransferase/2-methoxy-6-polyprenyl-1,4-benzoquinol methylase UbiE [Candidatus Brocadiaceae bacterium]